MTTRRILAVGEDLPPMDAPADRSPADRSKLKGKRDSRGRFESINAFIDVTMADLDRAELAVWLILWRDTKPDGSVRTSQADLARRAGCSVRSVCRAIAKLEQSGLVAILYQGGFPRRLSIYRVMPLAADRGHGRPQTEDEGVRA